MKRMVGGGFLLAASAALAQEPGNADAVVVTATRVPQPSLQVPASVDRIYADEIRDGRPQVNLSESLGRVPGIVVQNRQNYAQDLQISSRGFGARAAFGVRGIRLIADGIPATMPDGQGQAATFALGSAERIEVLRGPFSSLYGNAAGGVIVVETEDPPKAPTIGVDVMGAQLRYVACGNQARRLQHAARCLALRERRLSRAQRGAARSLQPQVQICAPAGHVAHTHRQSVTPAADPGSAGAGPDATRGEPAPGDAAGAPVRYAQDHLPGAARCHACASLERRLEDRGQRLRRQPLGRTIPCDSAHQPGAGHELGRSRAARPQLCRRRAEVLHLARRLAILARRRVRRHGRAPQRLHQQPRRARGAQARRGR